MRILMTAALMTMFPLSAHAADCGPLKLLDTIQMTRLGANGSDLVPVRVNDTPRNFLFDTGGFATSIGRGVATAMKLPTRQGNMQLYDAAGDVSRDQAVLSQFQFGKMSGKDLTLPIAPTIGPNAPFDGILAPDLLQRFDLDVDFNSDKLNLFLPDHCDGKVIYWTSPAAAGVVPIFYRNGHIVADVTLDGRQIDAVIDTGFSYSTLRTDDAQSMYNLTIGSADTPERGALNGDPTLMTYHHVFRTLSFGDVTVNNPDLTLIPNAAGRNAGHEQLLGDRTRTEADRVQAPEAIIGMDILRRMHVYIAFKEEKLYITSATAALPASPPAAAAPQ